MSTKEKNNGVDATKTNPFLTRLVAPHVDSFNWLVDKGISIVEKGLPRYKISPEIEMWIDGLTLTPPVEERSGKKAWPFQARIEHKSYTAPLYATFHFKRGDTVVPIKKRLGMIPVMVKSSICYLHKMSPKEMVKHNEEANEVGGYFIINGNEKIIRLLTVPRRHDVCAVVRPSFSRLGSLYSENSVSIRCVRPDQTSQSVHLHYLNDGSCTVRIMINRREWLIPVVVILKALIQTTDREIYERVMDGSDELALSDSLEVLLRENNKNKRFTQEQCLDFLGTTLRRLLPFFDEEASGVEAGLEFIRRYLFVHLTSNQDKFNLLIFMLQKLYSLVHGKSGADNQDSAMNHEVLLPGHIYLGILKERIMSTYRTMYYAVKSRSKPITDKNFAVTIKAALEKIEDVGGRLKTFLSTGNLVSESGLDLQQASGFTIIAEKLNYLRYMSHFQCIHRGSFFAEMKTTTPRKLLPESWGFVCPVHTPDGAPCGLLNHLGSTCEVPLNEGFHDEAHRHQFVSLVVALGVAPLLTPSSDGQQEPHLPVLLDGQVIGKIPLSVAPTLVGKLRALKSKGLKNIPKYLEIGYVPPPRTPSVKAGRYPGLFFLSGPARFTRPVQLLSTGDIEYIGSLEQVYLNIACLEDDVRPSTTHRELKPTNMLSTVALLTPFSDFNQSPRNMYQCQMGKQTMGTPMHSFPYRFDNKLYRIQNPQRPIARTESQSDYQVDEYPLGANAIVAVISYTGYDMEDAMIINKSAYERGFGHGSVYKSEVIDSDDTKRRFSSKEESLMRPYFNNTINSSDKGTVGQLFDEKLDSDGLPHIGTLLEKGDPMYCVYNPFTKEHKIQRFKNTEPAYVDQILITKSNEVGGIEQINFKLRFNRNPVIGDKFSSRHGQKGVLSQLWPLVDMPFSESGMTPDVIINPHAFPSRMTIGMLVESMAGKSGALHGLSHDSTPFHFDENNTAVDYFGKQLVKAGFNYYGNEPLYSGVHGTEFHADIYFGVVYYQRLRHMVKDKYQVRSTGPINQLTHQPIKGRKVGGGVRFGEMERDSLLAHGASFMLNDRLFRCSDATKAYVCKSCGSMISPMSDPARNTSGYKFDNDFHYCRLCNNDEGIEKIRLPFVVKYLTAELAAMNIRMTVSVK